MNLPLSSWRLQVILLWPLLLVGCAEDVGGRMSVVKTDMHQIQQMLSANPSGEPNTLAKASTVSQTARFTGAEAQKVMAGIESVASSIGYRKMINESQLDGAYVLFCHSIEPGRSISHTRSGVEATVSVRVSGWSDDRKKCSGNT